jgi:tRNA pseudouridine32 synthase/23S rRNA pseudouridine746 synthase
VLARNARAHSLLSQAFQNRKTQKRYIARIDEPLAPAEGDIDRPIGPDLDRRPRYRIDPEHGRPSQTRYRTLDTQPDFTRIALEPITGRSHQLRVHLLSLGRPIQGDSLYHPEHARHDRLMLHAEQLGFPDPETGIWQQYELPAPF